MPNMWKTIWALQLVFRFFQIGDSDEKIENAFIQRNEVNDGVFTSFCL